MRLLNTATLTLESFPSRPPPYAILSHTWLSGDDGPEPTLQDLLAGTHTRKPGWAKVESLCRAAAARGLAHAWADTVCIDKTSSAELSEAINAMWTWYRRAECCFVYLADVLDADLPPPPSPPPCDGDSPESSSSRQGAEDGEGPLVTADNANGSQTAQQQLQQGNTEENNDDDNESVPPGPSFERSRWFTRGWTLQELLAPRRRVIFLSQSWRRIGTRTSLASRISARTRIPVPVLLTGSWRQHRHSSYSESSSNAAARMSWAAGRATTRPEDAAYCLLGLFGIHMPLLYGEGGPRAFVRLQEEILRQGAGGGGQEEAEDCSLLVWDASALQDGDDFASSDEDDDDDDDNDDYVNDGGILHGHASVPAARRRKRIIVGALAPSADCFANSGAIACHPAAPDAPGSVITSTNRGLSIQMCIMMREGGPPDERLGVLPCHVRGDMATAVALPLVPLPLDDDGANNVVAAATAGGRGGRGSMMAAKQKTYARACAAPVLLPMVLPALATQPVLLPKRSSRGWWSTGASSITGGGGAGGASGSHTTWWLKYFSGNSCDLLSSWTSPWPSEYGAPSSLSPLTIPSSPSQTEPSPVFQPVRAKSSPPPSSKSFITPPPSWTRNDPTQTMTLLIPQTRMTPLGKVLPAPLGPVSTVAAFRVRGRDDDECFAVSMELGPGNGAARVELSAFDGVALRQAAGREDLLRLARRRGAGSTVLHLPSATVSVRFSVDNVRGTLTNVINVVCMRPLGRS
ncbi:hypothetical protein JDV02_010366 [Purpureocillium takamizusanense]|uniref:Heterokaryon incompatibility domain-containing protein n=1 Tax=Purpureocillium takamizusanense TaxID=2060973 RepID=A0A9Q8VGG9_9HYPO|nr:uncharacterized protein JDV02_010366 [Purpureocillium takamizusanense]UNI24633.1 hypothetical protein JDV02_010366 [Purpureocillium takamizusanense]